MAEVSFHFNVPDRLDYACRLLRKATRRDAKVVVAAPADVLNRFDKQLWVFGPLDFVPHVYAKPGQALAPRMHDTPVWLVEHSTQAPHRDVLLNLGDEIAGGFEQFARVIEVVSQDGDDRLAGRARWKRYAELGVEPKKHDVAQEAGA